MSESELLMIGISMILAAGLVKCVEGLYHATTSQQRYWIPKVLLWSTFVLRAHILTTKDAAQIEDWADHFDKSARPYFVVALMSSLLMLVTTWSNNESTGFDNTSIPFWLGAGLNATGAISEKVWVRGTVAVTLLILIVLGSYILFSNDLI
jgi:hypothetical protein